MFAIKTNTDETRSILSFETGKAVATAFVDRQIKHDDEEKLTLGQLLWVKIGNHPYWPCMVSYHPIEGCYWKTRKVKNKEVIVYHVQYFGKKVEHGWTTPGLIFPFEGLKEYKNLKKNLIKNAPTNSIKKQIKVKYNVVPAIQKAWLVAVREADEAFAVDIHERYEKYVFMYRTGLKKSTSLIGHSSKRHGDHSKSNKPIKKRRHSFDIEVLCNMCGSAGVDLYCSKCVSSFHKECLGLINAANPFKCCDCENGISSCFVCKKADTAARKCTVCTYNFHPECMKKLQCADFVKYICSHHFCMTCYKVNPRNISPKGPFVKCIQCLTSFHPFDDYCTPVGSVKIAPDLIICPQHFLGKNKVSPQPTCNVIYCSVCSEGGELIFCQSCPASFHKRCLNQDVPTGDFFCEDCSNKHYLYVGMIVWARTGDDCRWWPAKIICPSDLPTNVKKLEKYNGEFPVQYFGTYKYFWTHRGRVIPYAEHNKNVINPNSKHCKLTSQYKLALSEASSAYDNYMSEKEKRTSLKPDDYTHIEVNQAVPPACINIDSSFPLICNCDPNKPNPCGKDSCFNSIRIECPPSCPAGNNCENQRFQKRQYASVKIIKTELCGWGLATKELIKKGMFVIEYVGEVITHVEYRRRRAEMRKKNIRNYYFIYLDSRRMLDAGPKGNLARFINHSCDPNCQMQKWEVNRDLKIGIFALRDIAIGEELTFDYLPDSIQFGQICRCGAVGCKGLIGQKEKINMKA